MYETCTGIAKVDAASPVALAILLSFYLLVEGFAI